MSLYVAKVSILIVSRSTRTCCNWLMRWLSFFFSWCNQIHDSIVIGLLEGYELSRHPIDTDPCSFVRQSLVQARARSTHRRAFAQFTGEPSIPQRLNKGLGIEKTHSKAWKIPPCRTEVFRAHRCSKPSPNACRGDDRFLISPCSRLVLVTPSLLNSRVSRVNKGRLKSYTFLFIPVRCLLEAKRKGGTIKVSSGARGCGSLSHSRAKTKLAWVAGWPSRFFTLLFGICEHNLVSFP